MQRSATPPATPHHAVRRRWPAALLAAALGLFAGTAFAADRWQRMDAFLQQTTGAGGYPGAVAVVQLHGRTVFHGHWGYADLARQRPLREDAIFRIYSMSKPVASVAILMLMEEGKLSLDDPLARYIPAFADSRLVVGGDAASPRLAPAPRAITLRHLLTHTSGLAADADHHPVASALLARADEVVSGQLFASFLQQRVFRPLGMRDTGFEVPAGQRARVVDLPTSAADGSLRLADTASARTPGARLKAYDSGAGGLYSTAADYLRFARMLLGSGEADGVRLLARKTVDLMMADQLGGFAPAIQGFSRGEGFGLGGYVVTDPAVRGRLGSVGQFGWSGAASTWFTVDRKEGLVAILLMQYLPDGGKRLPLPATPFYNLVYQALP